MKTTRISRYPATLDGVPYAALTDGQRRIYDNLAKGASEDGLHRMIVTIEPQTGCTGYGYPTIRQEVSVPSIYAAVAAIIPQYVRNADDLVVSVSAERPGKSFGFVRGTYLTWGVQAIG